MKRKYLVLLISNILLSHLFGQCPNSVLLGSASNMFGMITNETTPVAVDNSINTVLFLHRNNVNQFGLNTGHLRMDVSYNAGQTWSTNIGVLNPNLTYGARYPNAVLYNPTSNTVATNAYMGYFCAAIGSAWGPIVSGGRQLGSSSGTENYNQPGVNNYLIPQSIVKSTQGVYWGVDFSSNGSNALTGSIYIFKGVWNSNINDISWTLNSTLSGAVNVSAWSYPVIGFDPTGQIGYVALMTDLNSNGYLSPTVFKTTNGGQNWSGSTTINLNQFSCLSSNTGGSNVSADNSLSLVVDSKGSPHIGFVAGKQSGYTVDASAWHHFIDLTSINGLWTVRDLGAIQTGKNTFNGSISGAIIHGWCPQASRTQDGNKIFFTWVDNINVSLGTGVSAPNLYGKGFDVTSEMWTPVKDFSSCSSSTSGKIFYPHVGREVISNSTNFKISPVYGEFSTTSNDVDIATNYRYLDNCTFASSEFTTSTPTITLSVSPFPNVILCNGSQAQVQVLGNNSQILWSNNSTTSITTVSAAGTLTVTARQGCTVGSQTISVQQLSFTASSTSVSICSGKSATLSSTGNALSYTWNPGAVIANSLVITPTVTSSYTLLAGGNSCSTSTVITLTVLPLPIVTIVSNYTRTCAGNPVTLQAAGASLYSWSNGATGSTTTVNPTQNTVYSLTAVSALGCLDTFTYSHAVDPTPNLTVMAQPSTICAGETSTLSIAGGFSYAWNTGSTTNSIIVSPATNSVYTVIGTNTLLCSSSQSIELKVNGCNSINESQGTLTFNAYPSPAANEITIQSNENGKLRLIDAIGQVLIEESVFTHSPIKIETTGLASGSYILFFQAQNSYSVKKVTIMHE